MPDLYDKVADASPVDTDGPYGWIQWKGTSVCIDLHCSCGRHSHVDAWFAYSFRCACGRLWGLDPHVVLVPLEEEDVAGACKPVEDPYGDDDA